LQKSNNCLTKFHGKLAVPVGKLQLPASLNFVNLRCRCCQPSHVGRHALTAR